MPLLCSASECASLPNALNCEPFLDSTKSLVRLMREYRSFTYVVHEGKIARFLDVMIVH